MIKGKTSSGFEFSIPENLKTDIRFLRAYRAMKCGRDEDEQLSGALDLVSAVFGGEAEETRFYEWLSAHEGGGRVPIDIVYKELGEIIKILTEQDSDIKNS